MANEELKHHAQMLHQQLESSKLTSEERDILSHLMTEILALLQDKEEEPDISTLQDRLEEHSIRFENRHPAVADTVRQVINALANMGI